MTARLVMGLIAVNGWQYYIAKCGMRTKVLKLKAYVWGLDS